MKIGAFHGTTYWWINEISYFWMKVWFIFFLYSLFGRFVKIIITQYHIDEQGHMNGFILCDMDVFWNNFKEYKY